MLAHSPPATQRFTDASRRVHWRCSPAKLRTLKPAPAQKRASSTDNGIAVGQSVFDQLQGNVGRYSGFRSWSMRPQPTPLDMYDHVTSSQLILIMDGRRFPTGSATGDLPEYDFRSKSGQVWRRTPEQRVAASTLRRYTLGLRLAIAQADTRPVMPISLR